MLQIDQALSIIMGGYSLNLLVNQLLWSEKMSIVLNVKIVSRRNCCSSFNLHYFFNLKSVLKSILIGEDTSQFSSLVRFGTRSGKFLTI